MDAKTSTENSPILIVSDDEDDDGDVLVVKEEPCDDVIFVSHTAAPLKPSVDASIIKNVTTAGFEDNAVVIQNREKSELTRSLSISSSMRVTLTISNDVDEIRGDPVVGGLGMPLDLSSRLKKDPDNCDMAPNSDSVDHCQTADIPDLNLLLPRVVKSENLSISHEDSDGGSVQSLLWQSTQSVSSPVSSGSAISSPGWTDEDDSDGSESDSDDGCIHSTSMPQNSAVIYATVNSANSNQSMPLVVPTSDISTSAANALSTTCKIAPMGKLTSNQQGSVSKNSLKRTFSDTQCQLSSSLKIPKSLSLWSSLSCDNSATSTSGASQFMAKPVLHVNEFSPLQAGAQTTFSSNYQLPVICNSDTSKSIFSKQSKSKENDGSSAFSLRNGTSSSTIQLPPKKQSCFRENNRDEDTMDTQQNIKTENQKFCQFMTDICTFCMMPLSGLKISRCVQGHATCGRCLEDKVKLVLTGKVQESIKCMEAGCDSYYPMSELKHSLPSMVVDILEEKLDQEYVDYIDNMIIKNDTEPMEEDTVVEESEEKKQKLSSYDRQVDEICNNSRDNIMAGLPNNWTMVDENMGYNLIAVEAGSEEYVRVALKFHASMDFPKSDIVKISRVQNPILYRYYSVKKLEMVQDNDGHTVDERDLFHGTNSSVVDAICNKGFDWRVSGKNGTVFGQGSYFAVDASYAHQYTDRPSKSLHSPFLSRTRLLFGPYTSIPPPAHVGLSSVSLPPPPPLPLPLQTSAAIMQQPNLASLPNPPLLNSITASVLPTNRRRIQFQTLPPPSAPTLVELTNQMTTSAASNSIQAGTSAQIQKYMQPLTALANPFFTATLLPTSQAMNAKTLVDKKHTRTVFLAKVLVGMYTGGNSAYRKPPPLFPDTDIYGRCYDSCVNDIHNPKIFVIFETAQAYPDYLLEYSYEECIIQDA